MPQEVEKRVEHLERKVELLEQLPDRVTSLESQILRLGDDLRDGFSGTKQVLQAQIVAGDEETRRVLRDEIRAGDGETRRFMRVLHEEVLDRIARMNDGRRP